MSNKRFDLQGLRAWAVLAVVIFHFFPSLLPYGYLGVDVFFVLSGFLITLIMEKKSCVIATYVDFFFKRFKRIFPLALLAALVNLLIISFNDDLVFVKVLTRSATYSLFFGTNYNVRDAAEDYFDAIDKATDYFTHYWSLSVEIQFYTLAPFLLHMLRPPSTRPALLLIYLSFIAAVSFSLSLYLPQQKAFSSTLCRLYQFLAGSMAYSLGEMSTQKPTDYELFATKQSTEEVAAELQFQQMNTDEMEIVVKPRTNVLYLIPLATIASGFVVVIAIADVDSLLRLAMTVTAAALIFLNSTSLLLCHPSLQLLGDASYALYLVHWPVTCLLKEWHIEDAPHVLAAIFACVVISVLIHFTYEKWYLTLSEYRTFALVGVLYLLCFSLVFYNSNRKRPVFLVGNIDPLETIYHYEPGSSVTFTAEQLQAMNTIMDDEVHVNYYNLSGCIPREEEPKLEFDFCHFPKNGTGKYSFLMIGNSYVFATARFVLDHFGAHYSSLATRAVSYCEVLIETKIPEIKAAHKTFLEDVEREKPDVLFITTRYIHPEEPIAGNISTDEIYLYMLNKLRMYEKLVKVKVFILNSIPLLREVVDAENWRKSKGLEIDGYMPESIRADDEPMRRRNKELAKNCDKCVFYDVRGQHLNEKGEFMTHDPVSKLRYFDRTLHYTVIGRKLIEPVFTEMSREFDRLLTSKYPENVFELKH